uniref:Reverse transcriptase domain-containing protein n=1 Tax=Glossina palpalis gambiensis TaxID=67801 RepID=A0A1B0BJJ7_9MUSC
MNERKTSVDCGKTFDKVQDDKLIYIVEGLIDNGKNIRGIKNLCWRQIAEVGGNDVSTNYIPINGGVHQGCIWPALPFNVCSELIFKELIETIKAYIKVNGQFINNIRYRDDATILADNMRDLQTIVQAVNDQSNSFGLSLNIMKTKFMIKNAFLICNTNFSAFTQLFNVEQKFEDDIQNDNA